MPSKKDIKNVLFCIFSVIVLLTSLYFLLFKYSFCHNETTKFFKTDKLLMFSNEAISAQKGNELSEFNVYLLKNLSTDKPKKSFISKFTMPFRKEIDFIPFDPATDLYWYNIVETGDNQWTFANVTSLGGSALFDISYSPFFKKLKVGEPIVSHYIVGFINGYDKKEGFFYTDQFGYYDRNGKEITDNPKLSGYLEILRKQIKSDVILDIVPLYIDDNTVVYNYYHNFEKKPFDLVKIQFSKNEKTSGKLCEKYTPEDKKNFELTYNLTKNKTGNRVYLPTGSRNCSFSPMAASPDKKKVTIVRNYEDISVFPPQQKPSYIKDYQDWSEVLWLVIWDIEKNEIEKVVPLPSQSQIKVMPFSMLWAPEPNSQFISYYCRDGLFIIDISKKTVKQLSGRDSTLNVIRWSPDGSMLGFLDDKGELYIYNVAKDTTTKINSDKDCFNFVWVK